MTNLGGHDMEAVLDAFHNVTDDAPTCFLAYTVKGYGLPFAGHKDNHGGLMNPDQMAAFKTQMGIADGAEWDRFAGLDLPAESLEAFLETVPFRTDQPRRPTAPRIEIPGRLPCPTVKKGSTQEGFGRILNEIAREKSPFADAIVTSSPDVTVTTNLGAWVNRRGRFDRARHDDTFQTERVVSAQKWGASPEGQHLELGIAENNLFLLLAALGLSGELFGTRLLPIGALYDPFIARGPRFAELRLLPGLAVHADLNAFRHQPRARGRAHTSPSIRHSSAWARRGLPCSNPPMWTSWRRS